MFTFNGIMRDDDEAYLLFVIGNKGYKYVIKEKKVDGRKWVSSRWKRSGTVRRM